MILHEYSIHQRIELWLSLGGHNGHSSKSWLQRTCPPPGSCIFPRTRSAKLQPVGSFQRLTISEWLLEGMGVLTEAEQPWVDGIVRFQTWMRHLRFSLSATGARESIKHLLLETHFSFFFQQLGYINPCWLHPPPVQVMVPKTVPRTVPAQHTTLRKENAPIDALPASLGPGYPLWGRPQISGLFSHFNIPES